MIYLLRWAKHKSWINYFVIYLRYLIGGAFVFSAMPKMMGERFMTQNGEDAPIDSIPHMFETLYRSGLYWEFLGWAQVIAALLLMTQRFSTLGAALFLPIVVNIFVITISYDFAGTPVITGLMLMANLFLLFWDYHKLKILFVSENHFIIEKELYNQKLFLHSFWMLLGFVLFLTTIAYVIIQGRNPMIWFLICIIEGLAGFIFMKVKQRKMPATTPHVNNYYTR